MLIAVLFRSAFVLPENIKTDQISASIDNGVLTVSL
jgi:HSP20 family molecular chaperone IbpA